MMDWTTMLLVGFVGTTLGTVAGIAADRLFLSRRRKDSDRAESCQSSRGRSDEAMKFLKMMDEMAADAPAYAALLTILLPVIPVAIVGLGMFVFVLFLNWTVALWPW